MSGGIIVSYDYINVPYMLVRRITSETCTNVNHCEEPLYNGRILPPAFDCC